MPANPPQTLGTILLTWIAWRDLYSSSTHSQLDDHGAMLDRALGPTDMLQRTDKSSTSLLLPLTPDSASSPVHMA